MQASAQVCRNVNNITVCGDTLVAESGTQFQLRGNIKLGPKGAPAVVVVENMETTFNFNNIDPVTYTSQFFHLDAPDPNSGATDILFGKVRFIGDTTSVQPLLATHYVTNPQDPNSVLTGRLFVDTAGARIFLPAQGAVPIFVTAGVTRNSNIRFPFMDRVGMQEFYKDGGTVGEFATIDAEFNLNTKKFTATLPLVLKIVGSNENPNLQLTLAATFDDKGVFGGTVNGFSLTLAGLVLDAKGIVLRKASDGKAEFEAATVDVAKAKNPDLPNLDPTKPPEILFSLQKLKYKNNQFSFGGVSLPINDWAFGDALKMTNQTIGIGNDAPQQANFFEIKSTLNFGSVGGGSLPITLKIGRRLVGNTPKPIMEAGLQNTTITMGNLKLNLIGVTFVGDGAENFFGIKATTAALQWPANLGGQQAAGVTGFKLGIKKDKKLDFSLGGATLALPPFESSVLKGTLAGTVAVIQETITFSITGNLTLKLAGNSNVGTTAVMTIRGGKNVQDTCPANSATCRKRYEQSLSGFNIKLAGFGLALQNPRGLPAGGFAAEQVALSLPSGLNGLNGQINGFSVLGNGNVSITGGGFELAPLTVGGFQFVGLKGTFIKSSAGYEFVAGGKLPLPGIEPGTNSAGISANVTIRANPDNSFKGAGVQVSFTSLPGAGLPIGQTGMEMIGIGGLFDVNTGTVQIGVTMKAASLLRVPAPINLPIATVDGAMTLQLNPFKLTSNAKLSVLIFNVATANISVGDGQGFSGGKGMFVQFQVNGVIVKGSAALRVGKVTVNNVTKTRVAASASFEVGLDKGQFGFAQPPFNINIASLSFSGGRFKDNRSNPSVETSGMLGTVKVGPFEGSLFVNFGKSIGSGDFVDLVNANKFSLLQAAAIRTLAAAQAPGYVSAALNPVQAQQLGLVLSAEQMAGNAPVIQETFPVTVDQTTTLVAGIHYTTGAPTLSLRLPDNSVLTKDNVDRNTTDAADIQPADQSVLIRSTDAVSGTDFVFMLAGAAPGVYTVIVDNAPADYTAVSYFLNSGPEVVITSATCGGGNTPGVTVSCANVAAAGVDAPEANQVNIAWNASDADGPNTVVSVGYVEAPAPGDPVDFTLIEILDDGLPLGAGAFAWSLDEVPTGKYRVVVIAEDEQNAPAYVASDLEITVTDKRPPAIPAGLQAVPQAGELLVKWEQNIEADLSGYEIGFGVVEQNQPDLANNFVYTRTMGPKEVITGTSNIVDGKLWGLEDDQEVFYGLRAYDISGNYSDWTPLLRATPWPLSPSAWTPVPNSAGNTTNIVVQVAFSTPLDPNTLAGGLRVLDAQGQPVAGAVFALMDLDGAKVVGLGFNPSDLLALDQVYTAVVKGGAEGVTAEDSRQMPADYTWKFTVDSFAADVYLPAVVR